MQRYLGKTAEDVPLVVQRGDNSTRLLEVQRRLVIYLHAIWARDFVITPIDEDFLHHGKYQPYIENNAIHLPGFYSDLTRHDGSRITGLEIYRAAAVHAAAHLVYTQHPLTAKPLEKWPKMLISVIEDARIEALLIRDFPLLKQLWCMQHTATPMHNQSAGDYLNRLARALLDETYQDEDSWISQGRALFNAVENIESSDISIQIGLSLAATFENRKIKFNPRTDRLTAPYRDDNRYVWAMATPESHQPQELPDCFFESKLLQGNNELTRPDEETKQLAEDKTKHKTPASDIYHYAEWDFKVQVETQSWVTVREKKPRPGALEVVSSIVMQHQDLLVRMKNLLQTIRFCGVRRIRKLEEGDEIDINAAIRALIDIRSGVQPDTRIMMRQMRKTRDISVLVLLDLSNSTNQKIAGQAHTVLELTRQISVLFAEVIASVGDPFAIHGFCSKSRHNVEYVRFKDFDQPYDDLAKARIAGMAGHNSTRMGSAIRHATHYLNAQASGKKLLMLITDGAPSDIDVRGTNYLTFDAKMAVQDAGRRGIHTHCVSLDANADEYVSRIFGARNYMVVDHIRCLPEKMLMIYAGLTV